MKIVKTREGFLAYINDGELTIDGSISETENLIEINTKYFDIDKDGNSLTLKLKKEYE